MGIKVGHESGRRIGLGEAQRLRTREKQFLRFLFLLGQLCGSQCHDRTPKWKEMQRNQLRKDAEDSPFSQECTLSFYACYGSIPKWSSFLSDPFFDLDRWFVLLDISLRCWISNSRIPNLHARRMSRHRAYPYLLRLQYLRKGISWHVFRDFLQRLESANCPSVTVGTSDSGHTLSIVGNQTAESISIVQSDSTNSLDVSVTQISQPGTPTTYQFTSSKIDTIRIYLGGGNDTLTYSLNGQNLTNHKAIFLNTGSGNVSANFDFGSAGVSIEKNLGLQITGGKGQDSIQAELGTITNHAHVGLQAALGAGMNWFAVELEGNLTSDGTAKINVSGGRGADQIGVVQPM